MQEISVSSLMFANKINQINNSLTRNRTAVQEISVSSLMFANKINQINQSKLGQKQFIGIVFPSLIT